MSQMSDNFPTQAPHEDALAQARAAVIQVLTSTAEQRDQILQDAAAEREGLLSGARAEATSVVDRARGSATQIRDEAEAEAAAIRGQAEVDAEQTRADAREEAEAILNEARGAAERIRDDATADAEKTLSAATSVAEQVRAGLAELSALDRHFALVADHDPRPGAAEGQTASETDETAGTECECSELAEDAVADVTDLDPAPQPLLTPEQVEDFMRQLAAHLDQLDRARSTGDRDGVGRVLHDLGDLAHRSHANELADLAHHLGPDARPDELDELIRRCYQVRQGHPASN